MQAASVQSRDDGYQILVSNVAAPLPNEDDVLVRVAATALNRADLLQARGLYPPPEGASPILGLECSGWREDTGEAVMCLLPGGGYAEYTTCPMGSFLPIPQGLPITEAAGFMETFITAYLNIFELGEIRQGARILVHGGGSGIGTSAIQLCREAGVEVWVTAGGSEKCERCIKLGAHRAINYREENFAEVIKDATDGEGVDLVLDCIGASYLKQNLSCLKKDGKLVLIGLMGGIKTEINLALLLGRRLQIIGSTLRSLSPERKGKIISGFQERFGEALEAGRIRPIVHTTLPLEEAQAAHELMKTSQHFGKIILSVDGNAAP